MKPINFKIGDVIETTLSINSNNSDKITHYATPNLSSELFYLLILSDLNQINCEYKWFKAKTNIGFVKFHDDVSYKRIVTFARSI